MRTRYWIDDFQQVYLVIDSFKDLLEVTLNADFRPLCGELAQAADIDVDALELDDRIYAHGSQAYAAIRGNP